MPGLFASEAQNEAGAEIASVEMSAESSVEVPVDSPELSAENRLEVEISGVEFENRVEEIALNQTSPQSEAAAAEVEQATNEAPGAESKDPIADLQPVALSDQMHVRTSRLRLRRNRKKWRRQPQCLQRMTCQKRSRKKPSPI